MYVSDHSEVEVHATDRRWKFMCKTPRTIACVHLRTLSSCQASWSPELPLRAVWSRGSELALRLFFIAATQMLSAKTCTCYDKAGQPMNTKSTKCCKKITAVNGTFIGCAVTARHFAKALIQKKPITVKCKSSCALNVDETTPGWGVFGYGPFRDDSSICKAAFVADVIGHKGGVATLLFSGRAWFHALWHMSLS